MWSLFDIKIMYVWYDFVPISFILIIFKISIIKRIWTCLFYIQVGQASGSGKDYSNPVWCPTQSDGAR